jgi:hypothetical protein
MGVHTIPAKTLIILFSHKGGEGVSQKVAVFPIQVTYMPL